MTKKVLSLILCLSFVISLAPIAITASGEQEIIKDGLVAWYDGVNNTENGHDANSTVWQDLAGDNDVTVDKNATNYFTDNAYHLKSAQYNFPKKLLDLINSNEFTVELSLGDLKKIGGSFATFINNSGNDNFSLFWRVDGNYIEFKCGSNDRPKIAEGFDYYKNSTVTVTFKVGGKCCMYVDGILIAETAAEKSIGATGSFFFGHASSSKAHEAEYRSMRFYNRALTNDEVINNATVDGNFDPDYVAPPSFVEVAQPKTNIIGDICLSTYITTEAQLRALKTADVKPANAIFYTNKALKITDAEGKNEFSTVEDVIKELDYKIIPTFYVKDNESAKAVVDYLSSIELIDAYIMSSVPEVVKHAREEYSSIRGIIDYTEKYKDKTVTNADLIDIRKTNTVNLAKVAVIPDTIATQDNVKYLNSRQITTWIGATQKVTTEKHAVTMLVSGTYGIISDNTEFVYDAASKYLSEASLTRTPLIIGHRGIPGTMPENTLEGAIEAYNQGADVIEVDIYLTIDNVIVINHDATTSKYNKNVNIENCLWAQLKELTYTHNGKEYKMPTLEDFFKEFKGKDCMIFIEIKSPKSKIVPAMKSLIEKYDIYDQCAVIAFETTNQLDDMASVYPEMPVGFLVSASYSGSTMLPSIQKTIGKYNTTYNPSYSGYTATYVRDAVMRGITTWPWTINGSTEVYKYIMYGHSGITTNNANVARELTEKLVAGYEQSKTGFKAGDTVNLNATRETYGHQSLNAEAQFVIIDGNDVASVLGNRLTFNKEGSVTVMAVENAMMENTKYTVYSQPITISTGEITPDTEPTATDTTTPVETVEEQSDSAPVGVIIAIIIGAVVAAAVIIAVVIIVVTKKKKKA